MFIAVFPDPIGEKSGEAVFTMAIPRPTLFLNIPIYPPVSEASIVRPTSYTTRRYLLDRIEGAYAYYVHEEDREILDLLDQTKKYGHVIYGESLLDWIIGTKNYYDMGSGLRPEDPKKE